MNLLSVYNSRLLSLPISSFGELCDCGTRIEDALNNGQLEKGESNPPTKKTYGGGTTTKAPNLINFPNIKTQVTEEGLEFFEGRLQQNQEKPWHSQWELREEGGDFPYCDFA
ncbi:hypothetical protein SO802_017707 [Lithocarpus litseifolius]|uniref:Uncharacterized protein n=1 Tax=Lithocarpus litseifolius TaxID=425828 RepID=A0AAW2CN34_9ROSI